MIARRKTAKSRASKTPSQTKAKTKKPKTRAQWAAEVRAAQEQHYQSFLNIGRVLNRAKRALKHGTFLEMINNDFSFSASTAQRLMAIARDPRLQKAAHGRLLPTSWRTNYELTKLDDAYFENALASGAINPQMTRADAKRARTVTIHSSKSEAPGKVVVPIYTRKQEPQSKVVVPIYRDEPEKIAPSSSPPEDAPLATLAEIERLVENLATTTERGEVRNDQAFEDRISAVAERLMKLIGRSTNATAN